MKYDVPLKYVFEKRLTDDMPCIIETRQKTVLGTPAGELLSVQVLSIVRIVICDKMVKQHELVFILLQSM